MTHASTAGEEVMRSFVQHEHRDLAAGIDHIHETACDLASLPADWMSSRLLEISHWVEHVDVTLNRVHTLREYRHGKALTDRGDALGSDPRNEVFGAAVPLD